MTAYIIHVSTDQKRKKHIKEELKKTNLTPIFILKGDKKDLSPEIVNNYFTGVEMNKVTNQTSCAYKHLLAYQEIEQKNEIALILEDDIYFYKNFNTRLTEILQEIESHNLENFMISIEDSTLKYIGKSLRVKNQLIYPKTHGRLAGAYLIDSKAATNMLTKIKKDKIHVPLDWYHNLCVKENYVNMYWSHPTICCQKSLNGRFASSLDDKSFGFKRIISFSLQKIYKRLLYQLR